jgi:metal-responsive CopG/Arc/MetJ family transcriptional regulator
MPARIEFADGSKEFYPSKREELVEDALRKLMTERQSLMLDGEAGIVFTLYQLQKELKDKGHSLDYDQLKESLEILTKVDIEIQSEDKETQLFFSPIETLGLKGKGSETQTFVRFSPLVTHSIKSGTYRLINYDKVMSYRSVIARQLHKRMSHHYTQASFTESYEILLTTIVRDFGLTPQKRIYQNLVGVENAIEEMKQNNVVLTCKVEKIFDTKPQTKLIDAKFKFQPHFDFIADVKKANARAKRVRELR